ncbi:MAG: RhuM family protein [Bacteroidota bacterium]
MNQVLIYQSEDGQAQLEVQFEKDTVWLTQAQMAQLFDQTKQNISLHINNCFREGELSPNSTVKESLIVQKEGRRKVKRNISFYNLDVIISVGYRVKSVRGTQFRQWATQRLRDFLVQGYIINEQRISQKNQELQVLKDGIRILSRAMQEGLDEAHPAWLDFFAKGLSLLDDYDHEQLDRTGISRQAAAYPESQEYRSVIQDMTTEFASAVFGKEKDQGFESALAQIRQSFDGKDLYPTLEEKAATLLYLVVKNHAFVDGNKRIAAACFLLFLQRNGMLYQESGQPIISNEALAGLTLFVASSKAEEMETVKRLVISVLNRNQQS